jgi:hypothetical protein
MSQLHHQIYVAEALRRLRQQPATARKLATLDWQTGQSANRRARRHAFALWLGHRLLALGERLHGWAERHAPAEVQPCACGEAHG